MGFCDPERAGKRHPAVATPAVTLNSLEEGSPEWKARLRECQQMAEFAPEIAAPSSSQREPVPALFDHQGSGLEFVDLLEPREE